MELKEKVEKQLSAGFESHEIYANLLKDGYSKEEIDREFKPAVTAHNTSSQPSAKGIILGIVFLLIVIFRIVRFSNASGDAAIFAFISIITGIGLMIFWFTRKRS